VVLRIGRNCSRRWNGFTGNGPRHVNVAVMADSNVRAVPDNALVVSTLCFASVVAGAVQSIVLPILPDIAQQLHISGSATSWVVTTSLIFAAVLAPVAGRFADLHGARTVLMLCMALLVAGSLLAACVASLPVLLAGRALQGAAGAVFPLALSVLRRELPKRRLTSAMALLSATIGIGGGLGPILAGVASGQRLEYRTVFWLAAAASAVALVGVSVAVPRRSSTVPGRVDVAGAALLCVGLVLLMVPLSQGSTWGWRSVTVTVMLVGSALFFSVFVLVERHRVAPLLDVRLMISRPILVTNLIGLLIGLLMFVFFLGVFQLVQTPRAIAGYGFTATAVVAAVVYRLPGTLASVLGAPIGGALVKAFGGRATAVTAGSVGTLGFGVLCYEHDRPYQVILGATAAGLAIGLGYAAMPALLMTAVPFEHIAVGTTVNALSRWVGGAAASSLVAVILARSTSDGKPADESAIVVIFAVGAVASVAVVLLARFGLPSGADGTRTRLRPAPAARATGAAGAPLKLVRP
jgi:MFS family permease